MLHVLPPHMLEEVISYCKAQMFPSQKASEVVMPNCESSDLCKEEKTEAPNATAAVSREGSLSRGSSISDLSDDFEIINAEDVEL